MPQKQVLRIFRALSGIAITAMLGASLAQAEAVKLKIDPEHTTVSFKIRHLFSKVTGAFDKYGGDIELDPKDLKTLKVKATIQAKSINTKVPERDKHLRSKDFFEVDKFKEIKFESLRVKSVEGKKATLLGNLTIRGITKEIELAVEFNGLGPDPYGGEKAGFAAVGLINRKDFGLKWNETLETGGFLVGDEVELIIEAEATKK